MPEYDYVNIPSEEQDIAQDLIDEALSAQPVIPHSAYPVKEAMRAVVKTRTGQEELFVRGANMEYGHRGIHGEESAVSNLINQMEGREGRITHLVILAGESGLLAPPCGNCRDVLCGFCDKDLVIYSAPPEGGLVTRGTLGDCLVEEFEEGNEKDIDHGALRQAERAWDLSHFSYNKPGDGVYSALIDTHEGMYHGIYLGDAPYHPRLPLGNATANLVARIQNGPFRFNIREIVIFGKEERPNVKYRDRSHLYETLCVIGAEEGKPANVPIHIVWDGGVERTTSDAWFPYPFGPYQLGKGEELKETLRKWKG